MKYTEFEFNDHKIEFWNSFLGKETILLDGQKASEKYSITGTRHAFNIDGKPMQLLSNYGWLREDKISLNLKQGEEIVHATSCKMNLRHKNLWLAIGVITGLAIAKFLT